MTIEETELGADREAKREQEIAALREQAHQAEVAKARAEAALEEQRKVQQFMTQQSNNASQQNSGPQNFTEEQWKAAEESTGLSRQQILASGQLADQVAEVKMKGFREELKKANERAERAEKAVNDFTARQGRDGVMGEFYDQNPAYGQYKKEINEFVNEFGQDALNDPDKRKRIFDKATVFVKGLAGGKVRQNNSGNSGSIKLGAVQGEFDSEAGDTERIDFTGLEEKSQRRMIEDLHDEVKESLSNDNDRKTALEKSLTNDKTGVRVDTASEWKETETRFARNGTAGGKKN